MPLRDGSLARLAGAKTPPAIHKRLCFDVLEQMLGALDYLSTKGLIHRDVKPENILYTHRGQHHYRFQLADFGLARSQSVANSLAGTLQYLAPEFQPRLSNIYADQSHKSDIWSLFGTIVAFESRFERYPPRTQDYVVLWNALRAQRKAFPNFESMANLHPDHRPSAAQLLVLAFEGRGLTTPRSVIPPLASLPEPPRSVAPNTRTAALRRQFGLDQGVIIYPPRVRGPRPGDRPPRQRPDPQPQAPGRGVAGPATAAVATPPQIRAHRDGEAKRRAEPRQPKLTLTTAVKATGEQDLSANTPLEQEPPVFQGTESDSKFQSSDTVARLV